MATEVIESDRIQSFFGKLEAERRVLSTCTDLYKTLTSHFTSLEKSLNHKTQTLDTKIQTLETETQKALVSLQERDSSIPEKRSSLSAEINAKKLAAITEFEKAEKEDETLVNRLKSVCRKMDSAGLLQLAMTKRKESNVLRSELKNALSECVDPPSLVLDVVEGFLKQKAAAKAAGKGGLTDRRWACALVVSELFPADELKEANKHKGPTFAGKVVERAVRVIVDWKGMMEGSGDGSSDMGPTEAATFLQLVVGFGLKEKVDEEFLKKLVLEFAARREVAKLAVPVFGDKMQDTINELVKNKKEIEAVYLSIESGLTDKFKPLSLLTSYLSNAKRTGRDILKNGKNSAAAMDEANTFEQKYTLDIIKCVEDYKLEAQFPLNALKKRLSAVKTALSKKKKGSAAASKPSSKRVHDSRGSRPPSIRPTKAARVSNSYPLRSPRVSLPPQSPGTKYATVYNYPTPSIYDGGSAASAYGSACVSGTHLLPASVSLTPQHYSLSGDSIGVAGNRLVSSSVGGLEAAYGGSYAYGAAPPSAYQPPAYEPAAYQPPSYAP